MRARARARRHALLVAALVCALGGTTRADGPPPVEVHSSVDKSPITIGTLFRLTVEVSAAPGTEIVLTQPTEKIGDFDIVDFGDLPPREADGKRIVSRWYQLAGYTPGNHLVKSPPVFYRVAGEELKEGPTDEALIEIESLLARPGAGTELRDIKGPEAVPIDWRPYYLAAGAALALLALALVLYRTLNRPKRQALAPPPPPAHLVAYQELERLRGRRLIELGAFKDYYSGLSAIVRTYLERRFTVRAPEMTTEEFLLATARQGVLERAHRALLGEFLAESDLVKFARHLPTIDDSERAFVAARRFVDETREDRATASPPAEELRAAG